MQIYRYLCTVITLAVTLHLNTYAISEAENNLVGAIHSGSTSDILEILKTQKPDVNAIVYEAPIINWATYRNNPSVVHLLINYGLQLPTNLQPDQPHENLSIQLLHDYALMLRQARNNPTKALFDQAVEHGFVPVVKLLLEQGIQVNADDLKHVKNLYMQTRDIIENKTYIPQEYAELVDAYERDTREFTRDEDRQFDKLNMIKENHIVKQDAYKLIGALLVRHLMPHVSKAGVLSQLPPDIQNYIATFLHSEIPSQPQTQEAMHGEIPPIQEEFPEYTQD